jgi:acyl-CoA thioester hydrolase
MSARIQHVRDVRVRLCETDASGFVNSTNYFIYMEEARGRFFDDIGCGADNREAPLSFIIASAKCDFFGQASFNQQIRISTHVAKIGTKSFHIFHEMMLADSGIKIAKGEAVIVCFNFEEQRTMLIPASLQSMLENHIAR